MERWTLCKNLRFIVESREVFELAMAESSRLLKFGRLKYHAIRMVFQRHEAPRRLAGGSRNMATGGIVFEENPNGDEASDSARRTAPLGELVRRRSRDPLPPQRACINCLVLAAHCHDAIDIATPLRQPSRQNAGAENIPGNTPGAPVWA
jgi:hypothetical protein